MYDYLHTSFQAQTLSSTVARLGELLDLKFNGKTSTDLLNHFGSVHKLITQLKDSGALDYDQLEIVLM